MTASAMEAVLAAPIVPLIGVAVTFSKLAVALLGLAVELSLEFAMTLSELGVGGFGP
jgi:hypothetical protein